MVVGVHVQIVIFTHGVQPGELDATPGEQPHLLVRGSTSPNGKYHYQQLNTLLHQLPRLMPNLKSVLLNVCFAGRSMHPTFMQNIVSTQLPIHVGAFTSILSIRNINVLHVMAYFAALLAPQPDRSHFKDPEPVLLVRRHLTAALAHGATECILAHLPDRDDANIGNVWDCVYAAGLLIPAGCKRSDTSFSVYSPSYMKIIRFTESWKTREQYLEELEPVHWNNVQRTAADPSAVPEVLINIPLTEVSESDPDESGSRSSYRSLLPIIAADQADVGHNPAPSSLESSTSMCIIC